jgi:hypothetical protein
MVIVLLTITSIAGIAIVYSLGHTAGYNKAWKEVKRDIMDGKVPWK